MRISRYREPSILKVARKNRLEIVAAQLSRREMVKFGLVGAGGYLAFKHGLSHWASGAPWGCDSRTPFGTGDFVSQASKGRDGNWTSPTSSSSAAAWASPTRSATPTRPTTPAW